MYIFLLQVSAHSFPHGMKTFPAAQVFLFSWKLGCMQPVHHKPHELQFNEKMKAKINEEEFEQANMRFPSLYRTIF